MACAGEADLERVGDGDDLHDAGVEQPLHPLAHRRLGQPDRLADGGVGRRPSSCSCSMIAFDDVVEREAVPSILGHHAAILAGRCDVCK